MHTAYAASRLLTHGTLDAERMTGRVRVHVVVGTVGLQRLGADVEGVSAGGGYVGGGQVQVDLLGVGGVGPAWSG